MATMRDIVDGAARRLRIIGAGEALDAGDADALLTALNDMMASWSKRGVDIGWSGALALSATFPLEDAHIEAVKAMLAVRAADDFGTSPSEVTVRDAREGWRMIQADYMVPDTMFVDRALRNMPSQRKVAL
ncbi:MAG: hypothetical protein D6773_11345 [Alphaproteobacteria bacterium]|nr:MAG: hypothetical protein D6773_11345 [Alphaproteobacteria bacterium]